MELSREQILEAVGVYLNLTVPDVERVLYYGDSIVWDPGDTPLNRLQILDPAALKNYREKYENTFQAGKEYGALAQAVNAMEGTLVQRPTRLAQLLGLHPWVLGQLLYQDAWVWVTPPDVSARGAVMPQATLERMRTENVSNAPLALMGVLATTSLPGAAVIKRCMTHLVQELQNLDLKQMQNDAGNSVFAPLAWEDWHTDLEAVVSAAKEQLQGGTSL